MACDSGAVIGVCAQLPLVVKAQHSRRDDRIGTSIHVCKVIGLNPSRLKLIADKIDACRYLASLAVEITLKGLVSIKIA